MDNLWLKVENIVAKGEIAQNEQFLLLSLCFQQELSEDSMLDYSTAYLITKIMDSNVVAC